MLVSLVYSRSSECQAWKQWTVPRPGLLGHFSQEKSKSTVDHSSEFLCFVAAIATKLKPRNCWRLLFRRQMNGMMNGENRSSSASTVLVT
ncbi:hypothetical protein ACOMHN_061923 [Nucella lapillus]